MTPEPVYTFVKGEGWVLGHVETLAFTNEWGEKLIVYKRKPNPDERGIFCRSDNEFYTTDGEADLKKWSENYLHYYHYADIRFPAEYGEDKIFEDAQWITVVKAS